MMNQGCALVLIGTPSKAIEMLLAGIAMVRATRSKNWLPFYLMHLARAYADSSANSRTLAAASTKR